jgi:putative endonuclease
MDRLAVGRDAERVAEDHLVAEGFRVLWRNVRIGPLEIDFVAQKGDLVVIAEVRTRGPGSFEGPLASITRTKRRALLRASRGLWRGRLKKRDDVRRVRIDVVAVSYGPEGASVEWIKGAITEQDG